MLAAAGTIGLEALPADGIDAAVESREARYLRFTSPQRYIGIRSLRKTLAINIASRTSPSVAARIEGQVGCGFSVLLMKRAFLSHRIDFLSRAEAIANHDKYKVLLAALDVEVISAAETLDSEIGSTDAEIVEKGLALLKTCDFMIFDCSLENWNYIGCIFEMAYAYQMGKPIIVYTGTTNNNQRPWLRYHATRIAVTQDHLVDAVSDLARNVT